MVNRCSESGWFRRIRATIDDVGEIVYVDEFTGARSYHWHTDDSRERCEDFLLLRVLRTERTNLASGGRALNRNTTLRRISV